MESTSIDLLHQALLDLLVKFDKICTDNNLTYFLDSGTALGAVRHGGFIPWDDDVDVAMPRDDYERLMEIGAKGLPDNLFLQTNELDPAYIMPFAKIRLGDTYYPEKGKGYKQLKHQGLFIDIFPYDKLPRDPEKARRRIKRSRFWYYLAVFSRRDYPGKKLPQKIVSAVLHRMPNRTVAGLHKFYRRFCMKYNASDSHLMTCFSWRMSQRKTYLFEDTELLPTKRLPFEGKSLPVVNDPHAYLQKMFGDYMTLPPADQRITHLTGAFRI